MSKITTEEVEKLSKLARVGLTKTEIDALAHDTSAILDYAKQLDEVDVSNVVPTSQVTGLMNVTRKDEVVECDINREELLCNTPETEKGFIKVKSVL